MGKSIKNNNVAVNGAEKKQWTTVPHNTETPEEYWEYLMNTNKKKAPRHSEEYWEYLVNSYKAYYHK